MSKNCGSYEKNVYIFKAHQRVCSSKYFLLFLRIPIVKSLNFMLIVKRVRFMAIGVLFVATEVTWFLMLVFDKKQDPAKYNSYISQIVIDWTMLTTIFPTYIKKWLIELLWWLKWAKIEIYPHSNTLVIDIVLVYCRPAAGCNCTRNW